MILPDGDCSMQLRSYQQAAVEAVIEQFEEVGSTLIVLPTGCGKTIVFSHVAERMRNRGRVMVLAHREELIWQAADKLERVTGAAPDIEMAEHQAGDSWFGRGADVVVSSIQTQNAGRNGTRMERFPPSEFGLLIVDEAHHVTASSYRKVIAHYRKNASLKVLGVTATPDRHDEQALGQIFETVAFDYELPDAIRDGWLTPIQQHAVHVDGLDYSAIRTTAGDLNGADLARVMEYEDNLHRIADPTFRIAAGRRTLVFAASLAHAERLTEIFNRHQPGCARWVHGGTPKEERRQIVRDYSAGIFQILVNVGVATEGFDSPGIEVVAIGRPTKSRSLYAQMVGRGTRPLPGLVDGEPNADERRLCIASSRKPQLEVLDFVGNSGKHKLVSTVDTLGGNRDEAVVARARAAVESAGRQGLPADAAEELDRAEREIAEEAERARRKNLRARANYSTTQVDPFDVLQVQPWRERGWDKGKEPSEKMRAFLERQGIAPDGLSFRACRQLIQEIIERRAQSKATFKQARVLRRFGYPTDMSFDEARRTIDAIAAAGWRRPESGGVAATACAAGTGETA